MRAFGSSPAREELTRQTGSIATGQSHTLTEFVAAAFHLIGKDWREHVVVDEHLIRPTDILKNKIDPSKVLDGLGWKARNCMKDVIRMMLEAEVTSLHQVRSVV